MKAERQSALKMTATATTLSASLIESETEESDEEYTPAHKRPKRSVATADEASHSELITPGVLEALDRTGTTDRNAMLIISEVAKGLGCKSEDVVLSRETIRRKRKDHRQETEIKRKELFKTEGPLTIHWDGKMLEDISGKQQVERLPVLVSGSVEEQLLGIPKLVSSTGAFIASAVFREISSWNLNDYIRAMCFDTTSSNTSRFNGACILLEEKIEKKLLYTACRHHISELLLGNVFTCEIGPSCGPNVGVFKRFQNSWSFVDQKNFDPDFKDLPNAQDIISSCKDYLEKTPKRSHTRDDYRELAELVIISLGSEPERGLRFIAPGAMHNARWMSKAIYSLKIWLFRQQEVIKLSKNERQGIRNVCIFILAHYAVYWFKTPLPLIAPRTDLKLLQNLAAEDSASSKAALNKLKNHLWYLSEELVALAFFDSEVDPSIKKQMLANLEREGSEERCLRVIVKEDEIKNKTLPDFVTKKTMDFFSILGIGTSFLSINPEDWHDNKEFLDTQELLKNFKVVNDSAERGVALISKFNKVITNDEEQKQYLLQVVSDHRKRFPNAAKKTLFK